MGVGGAGFPTHVKLAADTIDTLIINGAECEPYLSTDTREMLECSDTILSGIKIFADMTAGIVKGTITEAQSLGE